MFKIKAHGMIQSIYFYCINFHFILPSLSFVFVFVFDGSILSPVSINEIHLYWSNII